MKIILLLSALVIFTTPIATVQAAQTLDTSNLKQQIQILQTKIAQLKLQIANIMLQKEVFAESYLVMDISDNSIISQKNTDQLHSIASLTKLMNAVIAVENIDINQNITLQETMLKPEGYSPSLFLHSTVSVKNLLKASLIQSTNDASEALSYVVGNEKFLELMNQKAKELSMNNTYFYDVHGLNPKNRSTTSDIAKLLTYIYKNHPELLETTKDNNFWLPDATGKLLKFQNLNTFYNLSEFIGGKTGYLPEAKQSLASLFNLKGKTIAIILLQSTNRKTDATKIIELVKKNI